jgi:YbbR domain-containing protein
MNKQFLIFVFFLFLSGIFWLIITLNETYEQEIKIPAQVVNVPKNAVLTSASTDTVRATIRDKGWVIVSYLYGERNKTITIPFKNFDKGFGKGSVGSTDLKRMIEQVLEASSKLVSVKPDKLEFSYNNGECKRVPVRWAGRVIPDQLYYISQTIIVPDTVEIYASKEKLDSIVDISTEPLNYVSFRDTLSIDCQLATLNDVKIVPNRAHITFYTDVLTEETMGNVPIHCINLPLGKVLRTFPPKVKVHFVSGVSLLRTLQPQDFEVIADYNEIASNPQEKCNIYLRSVPDGVSRATLNVKQVDYLIEEE